MKTLAIAVLVALLVSVPATVSAVSNSWSNDRLTRVVKNQREQIRYLRYTVRYNYHFSLCNFELSPEGSAFEGQQGERAESCATVRSLERRYPR